MTSIGSHAPTNPDSASTMACSSSSSTLAAPIANPSSGARRRTVTAPDPCQWAPSSTAGSATTRKPWRRSSTGTMALGVVEGRGGDDRATAVDLDLGRERRPAEPAEHERPAHQRREPGGRDIADDLAAGPDRRTFDRRGSRHREADPAAVILELRGPLERAPPDEPRLLHPHGPVHAQPARRRVELGVHPDDDVTLLEAEAEQRLEPVRADAEIAAELEQRAPQLDRAVDRVVELEGGLAGERQTHHVARDAGDVRADVTEEPGRIGDPGAPEEVAGERSGHVDRAERHRPVEDVHTEALDVDPVPDPHL